MGMDNPTNKEKDANKSQLTQINCFVEDLMRLASYAVESGRLPDQINLAEIYRAYSHKIEDGLPLSGNEIELLQYYYQLLKIELDPVTATSLRATECTNGQDPMKTEAGNRVKTLWYWAFGAMATILAINLYQYVFEFYSPDWAVKYPESFASLSIGYWIAVSLAPFAYGALGASLRILRVVESSLRNRSFDPRRMPEHRTRWVLGTISGGVIVMLYSSGGINDSSVKLTEVALGFLAGYSIDLLFSVLDNLVNILSPAKISSNQSHQKTKIQVPMKLAEIRKEVSQETNNQETTKATAKGQPPTPVAPVIKNI